MIQRLLLAVIFVGTFIAPAGAVTVTGLYSVEVPVAGSAPGDLQAGYEEGLSRVLLRVSGSDDVLGREGAADLLGRAETFLQSYQLLRADSDNPRDRLRMTFGAVGVNQALASLDAPVWGANRPLSLGWIAVEGTGGRQLLVESAAGSSADWHRAFTKAASDRGLPLAFPPARFSGDRDLMSDIWGQFMGRLRTASENVEHDLLAAVRVSRSGGQWRATWIYEGAGFDESESSVTADSPDALAARVVGRWADLLASTYAVAAGEIGELPQVDIVLDQVASLDDYAEVKAALDGMAPVQSVDPVRVTSRRATIRVAFSGELDQLKEHIALDARFVPRSGAEQPEAAATDSAAGRSPTEGAAAAGAAAPAMSESVATTGDTAVAGGPGVADPLFKYQPLMVEGQEVEQAFESLYQVLHYRWQSAPGAGRPTGE